MSKVEFMRIRINKWVVGFPLALMVVVVIGLVLLDSWLESGAGRAQLESAMARALAVPVHLQGRFRVRLLPDLGVSGDAIRIEEPDTGAVLMQADTYHASVELWPLINGELIVNSVRVVGGYVDPDVFGTFGAQSSSDSSTQPRLPVIELFQLENVSVDIGTSNDLKLAIDWLQVNGFAAGRNTPFELRASVRGRSETLAEFDGAGNLFLDAGLSSLQLELPAFVLGVSGIELKGRSGEFEWDIPAQDMQIQLGLESTGWGSGDLSANFAFPGSEGDLALRLIPEGQQSAAHLAVDFKQTSDGVEATSIKGEVVGQVISGAGCVHTGSNPSIDLKLAANQLNLDLLQSWLPAGGGGPGGESKPMDNLNLLLSVQELTVAGILAQGVELEIGAAPDCQDVTF